jgi:hypothetical protein
VNIERWMRRISERREHLPPLALTMDAFAIEPAFNPQPVELEADACHANAAVLMVEIGRDEAEIKHWTNLRDQHRAMLAAEEAKAKVLAAFSERTIEAGKMPTAAE